MKRLLFLIFIFIFINCKSQDLKGFASYKADTIYLDRLKVKQVVLLTYHDIKFLLDFSKVKKEFLRLSTGQNRASTAKELLYKITQGVQVSDTAYLDQEFFEKISWVPLDGLLCNWIESNECQILDLNNSPINPIIRVRGVRKSNNHYYWGGILYFVPCHNSWFKECTEWES